MIIHLKKDTPAHIISEGITFYSGFCFEETSQIVMITSSTVKEPLDILKPFVLDTFVMNDDIQLASKTYIPQTREVKIGDISIGGGSNNTVMISGPCSVESEEQLFSTAEFLYNKGVRILRGGCYKPRTSPYTFQGLGKKGLDLLVKAKEKFGMQIITEVKDHSHVQEVIEHTDWIQIGAKAMYDQGILNACAKTTKPVLLKRGFGSTLQEFVQAAEFILSGGNPNVTLCERGIRTFETKTRFTLDLCGVAYLKHHTNLPIILDPSHALGYAYGVSDLARACAAMGIDGLMIETHPNPKVAKSDASQQLNFEQFGALQDSLHPILNAVGKKLV